MIVLGFLISWVGLSIAVAIAADTKGRSAGAWFFLALLISPLVAGCIVLALPPLAIPPSLLARFEAQGVYKGTPYRATSGSHIEAMLPGGKVIFRDMEEFTAAIDGRTIPLREPDPEFPEEVNDYRFHVEKDGTVSAVNGLGERVKFRDWRSFWKAAHPQA